MKPNRTTTGLLLLVALAFLGLLLVLVPSKLVELYGAARELSPWLSRVYLVTVGAGAALLLVSSVWIVFRIWRGTRAKRARREMGAKNPSQLSAEQQRQETEQNLLAVEELQAGEAVSPELQEHLSQLAERVEQKRESQQLEIVAFGTVSSGKSSLLNALAGRDVFRTDAKGGTTVSRNEIPWPGMDQVTLVDTPGLGEIDGAQRVRLAAESAKDADLVLMVVDGPLRQSEHELMEQLGEMEKRVLVCLNKEDWFSDEDRQQLLGQIRQQVKDFVRDEDVVSVQALPTERTRVRVLSDGSEQEETVPVEADIEPLAERMMRIVQRDGRQLLLANLLLQSRGLVDDARQRLRQSLDRRAWEVVDKYTWAAGGAAAISPLPLVDLAAGSAITAKMVVDLGRVYRQEMDADTAVNLLGQLGKNLIAILGASAATPAVASVVASLLKTVPGAGTIAGGLLQGFVQALVTRWIGAVFIGYFKEELQKEDKTALASLARRQWQRLTSAGELRKFMSAARQHLAPTRQESERSEQP